MASTYANVIFNAPLPLGGYESEDYAAEQEAPQVSEPEEVGRAQEVQEMDLDIDGEGFIQLPPEQGAAEQGRSGKKSRRIDSNRSMMQE